MRWMLAMLLAGCSTTADGVPDVAEGPNLLRNGDFEYLDGSGWVAEWENFDTNPDGQIVAVTMAHSGSHALQWQIDAAGDGREYWVTQHGLTPQALRAGQRYALAGWYFVDAPGDVGLSYIVRGQPGNEPDLNTLADAPLFPSVVGAWAEFRWELTLPADVPETWDVSLHTIKFNGAATNLTLDEVRLVELAP